MLRLRFSTRSSRPDLVPMFLWPWLEEGQDDLCSWQTLGEWCPHAKSAQQGAALLSVTSLIRVSCNRWGRCALQGPLGGCGCHSRCWGPAAIARLGAGWPGWRQLAQHIGPSMGVHGGQRSPLWGSTLRVSLGWLRDSLGKREATLGRLFLFSGSPGGVTSTKKGIS